MTKNKLFSILILFFVFCLVAGFFSKVREKISRHIPREVITDIENNSKTVVPEDKSKPLDYSVSLDTPKGVLIIQLTEGSIFINPTEGNKSENNFKPDLTVRKDNYPKLFQQGQANASLISAKVVDGINIELSNNEPDRGSYSASYRLIVNPITGEIKENINPRRDDTLSKEDSKYLNSYSLISKLVGNQSLWKLNKTKLVVDESKLESLVTIPISSSVSQELYIFDKDNLFLKEKGYGINVRVDKNTIEVRFKSDMVGTGEDAINVKVYEVDNQNKTLIKVNEYREVILKSQIFTVGKLTLQALFLNGEGCSSCHGQTLSISTIVDDNTNLLIEDGTDIRVKVIGNNIVVKSQLSGGGAPSPGTMGIVKVYAVDSQNKILNKIKEYQEEYTLKDYEDK
ncbi:MAG: hypothetical protein PHD49_00120 [Candidatus Shapirobacteria bacterium]|nr:hypothetical protein [Candidatus Shapirobacteria bacterium]